MLSGKILFGEAGTLPICQRRSIYADKVDEDLSSPTVSAKEVFVKLEFCAPRLTLSAILVGLEVELEEM